MSFHEKHPISGAQRNEYHDLLMKPPFVPDVIRGGVANPNLRVYIANFDGTANSRDDFKEKKFVGDEQATLVAASDKKFNDAKESGAKYLESKYYPGVGTCKGLAQWPEKLFGTGCKRNAEQAHAEFVEQVNKWKEENPNVEVHVHAVGFSRGSSSALHFLNLVHDHGAHGKGAIVNKEKDRCLPGNVKSSAVIFDHVSTGQYGHLKLGIPKSAVAVLHLIAGGEQRGFFPLRSIDNESDTEISYVNGASMMNSSPGESGFLAFKRLMNVVLPAARHSDVGGSYRDGGIREVSEFFADYFHRSLGLPINPQKPDFMEVQKLEFHDSRGLKLGSDTEYLQKSKRVVKKSETEIEQNHFAMHTCIESSGSPPKSTVKLMHSDSAEAPRDINSLVGCEHELLFKYNISGYGDKALPGMPNLCVMSKSPSFSIIEGVIHFAGEPMQGVPRIDEINETLKNECQSNGYRPGKKITIDFRRIGVHTEVARSPLVPDPVWNQCPEDPVPTKIMEAMRFLNDMTNHSITASHGSQMVNSAMCDVAKKIQQQYPDDIESIRIYHAPRTRTSKDSSVDDKSVFIERVMKKGSQFDIRNPARDVDGTCNLEKFEASKLSCLEMLIHELRKFDIVPTNDCDQTFKFDDTWDGRLKSSPRSMELQNIKFDIPPRVNAILNSVISKLIGGNESLSIHPQMKSSTERRSVP